MENYRAQYDEIMDSTVYNFKDGDSRVLKLLEKAIQLSDLMKDVEEQIYSRELYIEKATFCNRGDKALTVFPWLLAEYDKNPENFDVYQLLWSYKWMLDDLVYITSIKKQTILDTLEDFRIRSEKAGFGKKVYLEYSRYLFMEMGDLKKAKETHEAIPLAKGNSPISDCEACLIHDEAAFLFKLGEFEEGLKVAEPVLKGKKTCHSKPINTYNRALPVLLQLYKESNHSTQWMKTADRYFSEFEKLYKKEMYKEYEYSNVLTYLAVKKEFVKAIRYLEQFIKIVYLKINKYDRHELYRNAWFLFEQMKKEKHTELKMTLPKEWNISEQNETYKIEDLIIFFKTETQKIANEFNSRNENDFFTQKVAKQFELLD